MTDEAESLALRYLRQIDERTTRMAEDVKDIKFRMTSLGERMAGVEASVAGVQRRIDRVQERLDRIERRLDRVEEAR